MQYNPEPLYHHYRDEALRIMGLLSHDDDPPLGWTFDERVWTAAIYARIALMRKRELFGDDALTDEEKEALGWNGQAGFDTDLGRWYLLGARYLALNALINGRLAEVLGQQPN